MISFEVSFEVSPSLVGCNFFYSVLKFHLKNLLYFLGLLFQTKLIVSLFMDYLLLQQYITILQ